MQPLRALVLISVLVALAACTKKSDTAPIPKASQIHCRTCASVTHWEPLEPVPGGRHGVNLGNFPPSLIAAVRVRRFDGADTWTFLDP